MLDLQLRLQLTTKLGTALGTIGGGAYFALGHALAADRNLHAHLLAPPREYGQLCDGKHNGGSTLA